MSYGACIIAIVIYILSALSNSKKFRLIPCPNVGIVNVFIQILMIVLKVLLTGTFVVDG